MIVNSLIVSYDGGEVLVEDTASIISHGRRRSTLQVKDVTDRTAAVKKGQQEMERLEATDSKTSLEIDAPVGSGYVPYRNLKLSNWFDVEPGWSGSGSDSVRAVGFTLGFEDEYADWKVEAQSEQEDSAERLAHAIGRASPGTLGGRSSTAAVKPGDDPQIRSGKLPYEELTWSGDQGYLRVSPTQRVSKKSRLTFLDFTRGYDPPGSDSPMGITVTVNGTPVSKIYQNNIGPNSAMVVPVTVNHAIGLIYETVVFETDSISFEITSGASSHFSFTLLACHLE